MMDFFTSFGGVTIVGSIIGIIFAYFTGRSKGKAKAEKESSEQQTKQILDDIRKEAEVRQQSASEAKNVQETVTRMPDSDVRDKLREKWRIPADKDN